MRQTVDGVVVCTVQLQPRRCRDLDEVGALLAEPVRAASRAGAGLVVLPQVAELVDREHCPGTDALRQTVADLARQAGVYVAVGLAEAGNVGLVFSPRGDTLGRQLQTHVLPGERGSGLAAGSELLAFPTDMGCLGLLVDTDAWYPEVSRILALQGVEILVSLQAVRRPYSRWRQLAGLWQQVQQNQTFGVESCLHGCLPSPAGDAGVEFEGRSAVFAPCEMTPGETGILNDQPGEGGLVLARLDFAARREVIGRYPVLGLLNRRLCRRYFPAVYLSRGGAAAPSPGGASDPCRGGVVETARAERCERDGGVAPGWSAVAWGKEKAFGLLLRWKSRPSLVRRAVAAGLVVGAGEGGVRCGAGDARPDPGIGETSRVRVAAVQMKLELVRSADEYARRVLRLARRAAEGGARLVAFPEDVATSLVGFLPGIDRLVAQGDVGRAVRNLGEDVRVADVFRFIAPGVRRVHEATFSEVARRLHVYVVAGSAILPDSRARMVNVAQVYGPDGRKLGEQEKCHLIPMEVEWGLETGDDLVVFEAPWFRFAAPVCMDATYFETFRILALRGAEVVVVPSANPEEYNLWKALRGIWPRVQESQVFGVHSCMVGVFLGTTLTGRSGIFAPAEISPREDGVLAQAERFDEEDVVVADLDLAALRRLRHDRGVQVGYNLALYERYFPGIYGCAPGG